MNHIFQSVNTHSVRYGKELPTFLANKIWSLIPAEIQNSETLQIFHKCFYGKQMTALVGSVKFIYLN